MKVKKIFKGLGIALLILLALVAVILIITTIASNVRYGKAKKYVQEKGYYNLVSAGDYDVNVYTCGNENGRHTIVAMAGYLDCEMYIGWRIMTAELEKDNRVVFVDRAGYGISDDCKDEMTAEHYVEHYRTALKNAGIEGPYVLMPHSIGGVYATYWQSKYPEEIEALAIIDGTDIQHFEPDEIPDFSITKLVQIGGKIGVIKPMIDSEYADLLGFMTEDEQAAAKGLLEKTMGSSAATNEIFSMHKSCNDVWDMLTPNDIPKMYLNCSNAFHSKEELLRAGYTLDFIRACVPNDGTDDEVCTAYLERLEGQRAIIMAYTEKMGNCVITELPGQHEIMFHKPEEAGKVIKEFIDSLD